MQSGAWMEVIDEPTSAGDEPQVVAVTS